MSPAACWTAVALVVLVAALCCWLSRGADRVARALEGSRVDPGVDAYFKTAAAVIRETDWDAEYRDLCEKEGGR